MVLAWDYVDHLLANISSFHFSHTDLSPTWVFCLCDISEWQIWQHQSSDYTLLPSSKIPGQPSQDFHDLCLLHPLQSSLPSPLISILHTGHTKCFTDSGIVTSFPASRLCLYVLLYLECLSLAWQTASLFQDLIQVSTPLLVSLTPLSSVLSTTSFLLLYVVHSYIVSFPHCVAIIWFYIRLNYLIITFPILQILFLLHSSV